MNTLAEIEIATREFSDAHEDLSSIVSGLNEDIERLKRSRIAVIKRHVARATEKHAALAAMIEGNKALFDKPRTIVVHGIKIGLRKGTGGIDWDDDEKVASLIKKHLPEQYEVLVKTTHKPQAKAMKQLEVGELKKIGCRVEETGDVVVIKPADSEVEKIVAALLKNATESEEVA